MRKSITLIMVCLMLCSLTACSQKNTETTTEKSSALTGSMDEGLQEQESTEQEQMMSLLGSELSESNAEISEKAMANFVSRLETGNYVVNIDSKKTTEVYSPDLVCFYYEDERIEDEALMTLNNETFHAVLDEDSVGDISFLSTGNAIQLASYALPNYWITETEGNMFNIFYNNVDIPLEFVSYDDTVKLTLLSLAGYSTAALDLTHEVYMTLDAEDPSEVHFTAEVDDNPVTRIYYDDLDFTLQFGNASEDERVAAWMSAPVYPDTRTAWTEDDIFYLNSVFMPGYGEDAVPFPDFASYAMTLNEDVFDSRGEIYYTDAHAEKSDLNSYVKTLMEAGFTEASGILNDGSTATVYRRVLREDYQCYVSIYPHMEEGFILEASVYYDEPAYNSRGEINGVITSYGFAELSDNEHLNGWNAVDHAASRSESWLYFFDYDLYLLASARIGSEDDAEAFLKEYCSRLSKMGFLETSSSSDPEEGISGKYQSADGFTVFRYWINDGETMSMEFRREKCVSSEGIVRLIKDAGIPVPSLSDAASGKDITRYYKVSQGFKGQLYLAVSQSFESVEDAEMFLDKYAAELDKAGYLETDPDNVGSLKQFVFYNEDADKYVALDYFPGEESADINFDFVSN